jgi:hypothetical protein
MSDLTPAASWDAVVQLSGTMAGVPATWNVPNQALLNRTEWLKTFGVFKNTKGDVGLGSSPADFGATVRNFEIYNTTGAQFRAFGAIVDLICTANDASGTAVVGARSNNNLEFITNSLVRWYIDTATGALLSKLGSFGYAVGAGGTVTQATSKSTGVTLSKPSGSITLNAAALASGASVSFTLTNTMLSPLDVLHVAVQWGAFTPENYEVRAACGNGVARITLKNVSGGSLSEALVLNFALVKVSNT